MRFALAAGLVLSSEPARADDLSTIRERVFESLTANAADVADADVKSVRQSIVNQAQTLLGQIEANGKFPDLAYTDTPGGGWSVNTHFSRLLVMAQAYQLQGLSLYHSPALKTALTNGLSYGGGPYCGAKSCVAGNWWFWQIGVPNSLTPTLVLLQGELDSGVFTTIANKVAFHLGDNSMTLTGENLLWVSLNQLRVAAARGDAAALAPIQKAVALTTVLAPKPLTDGIKPDFSFEQHGGQLYNGGYGAAYADDITTYLQLTAGTGAALDAPARDAALGYLLDGASWSSFGGFWDIAVMGREYSRSGAGRATLLRSAMIKASFVDSPRQAQCQARALWLEGALGKANALSTFTLEGQLLASTAKPDAPSGHRHFPDTDYAVQRRDGYFLSVKMFSTRTRSGELINDEGKHGSRQSDGRIDILRSGGEYLKPNVLPALDWSRLPGITVERTANAANETYGVGTTTFVGGTGDGQNGAAAMDFKPLGGTLTAKKSWFFFDDFAVFLLADVRSTSTAPVETIIEQWPLSKPDVPLVADGKQVANAPYSGVVKGSSWLSADGLGYYFPSPTDVQVDIADRTGNWSDLGTSSGSASARLLTLSLQHGSKVAGASAAYAIALGGQDMAKWATSSPFTVLKNDAKLAAVSNGSSAGIVFWSAGSVDLAPLPQIQADTPCVVWLTDDGNRVAVSVADPAQGSGNMVLTVTGGFPKTVDATGLALSESSVTLTVPRSGGVSHTYQLLRTTPINVGGTGGGNIAGASAGVDAGGSGQAGMGGSASTASGGVEGLAGNGSQSLPPDNSGCSCRLAPSRQTSGNVTLIGALSSALLLLRARRKKLRGVFVSD